MNAPGGKGGYGKASAAEAFLVKNLAALGVNSYHFTYLAFVKFAEGDEERLRTEVERLANSEEDAEEDLGVEGEESEEGEEERGRGRGGGGGGRGGGRGGRTRGRTSRPHPTRPRASGPW